MQHHIMNPIYDCILIHIWYDTISCTIFCIHNQFQKQHHLYTDALNPGKNNLFKEMLKTSIKINLYQKSLHLIYPYNISSLLLLIYRWYKHIFTRVKSFYFKSILSTRYSRKQDGKLSFKTNKSQNHH